MVSRARKAGLEAPFEIRTKKRAAHARTCDWPGCEDEGEHRTSRSPREMGSYVWYCMDHIREHNKSWNYFQDLTDDEVEEVIKNDTVWQRPTWDLGSKADKDKARAFAAGARIQDDFSLFEDGPLGKKRDPKNRVFHPSSPEAKAYAVMDLTPPTNVDEVKVRYKKLVKRHHPDANGGSKEAEETFKEIALAYQTILQHLGS